MPQSYQLQIISVSGIHWKPDTLSLHRDAPNLYVEIDIDNKRVHRSSAKRDWGGMWNDLAPLSAESPSSRIVLQVFHKRTLKDKCLAKAELEIGLLLEKCSIQKDFHVPLNHVGKNVTEISQPELVVRMTTIGRIQAGAFALASATQDSAAFKSGKARAVVNLVDSGEQHGDLVSTLGTLVARLDVVVHIGAEMAKIHPYSNAAWKVLTSVYEAVKKQQKTDEKIVQLVRTMAEVYSFAEDIESLPEKLKHLEDTVTELVKQTAECALFIREYTGNGFCTRLLTEIWSEHNKKIDTFTLAFIELQKSLDSGLVMHTAFVSTKTLGMVEGLAQTERLKSLRAIDMNASMRKGCLPGTRRDLLSVITNWLTTPSDMGNPGNILWLHGVAGAGKSTIATSVSEYFDELDRLGAFLFFNRTDPVGSSPGSVIRTIAFLLARSNTHVASAICTAIEHNPALVDATMQTQFQKLLFEPLTAAESHISGPIIIILDALDECGDLDSRRSLVSMLSNEFLKLPSIFRFFITSRPDSDIASKFEIQPRITKLLLDITLPSSVADIRHYIDNQMGEIRQQHSHWALDPMWPGDMKTAALAAYSSGLFIWASTATKLLLKAHDPNLALDALLRKGLNLDDLYAVALQSTGLWDDSPLEEDTQAFIQNAQAALSAVVLGKIPMSAATVDALLNLEPRNSSSHIFSRLGCVLQWSPGQLVRVLHASFADYLTDPDRSGQRPWFINHTVLEHQLARGCLRVLKAGLQFNICQLQDSHLRNTEVQDLSERITTHIPAHLSYSSLFWASHLQSTDSDAHILADINDLMDNKFLFWLEVLSILQETSIAVDALAIVGKLAKNHDETLTDFSLDAIKFVVTFAPVIAQSVPHIYLSAVPLAPSQSRVWKKFSALFVRTVDIQSCSGIEWPRLQTTIEGHTRTVRSVSFSPDGKRIVSGSDDGTIRVWDARTGGLVAGPFTGHSARISSVAFSPNGEHIVSGSDDRTMCLWDARTGTLVARPFEHEGLVRSISFSPDGGQIVSGSSDGTVRIWNAHIDSPTMVGLIRHSAWAWVCSVAFSPNGDRIASGSTDTTIQVWDAHTGALVTGPIEGHKRAVRSVAFSPDGERIVSGSEDATISVWDASTGALIVGPFTGHTDGVYSVAFSPDGEHIISGSYDRTLCIWDSRLGTLVASPFEGHNHSVVSVSFSPDGGRIVSGSLDHTVRIWDAHLEPKYDREHIGLGSDTSQTGHSDKINCVVFSPNGQHIVSGSDDETIRVWDSHTGVPIAGPFMGHTDRVLSLAFSLSGEHIISGSNDRTVRVWDAQTGTLIAGPFEYSGPVNSLSFSLDGKRIVSCSEDGMIEVRDAHTGVLASGPFLEGCDEVDGISLASSLDEEVNDFSFASSPGQQHIITGSEDGMLQVWDAQTGALVSGPFKFEEYAGEITCLSSSPDGGWVVSGSTDSMVRMWDVQTGSHIPLLLQGHSRDIYSVTFSRDGKWIVSGSHDKTVRVWNVHGLCVAGPFEGHSAPVCSVAFSPDGGRVASGSRDNTIRVFEINPQGTLHQPFGDGSRFEDGWILNSASQLILWIPPWLRKGLYFPQNSLIISREGTTKLDFSRFVHGTSWQECMDPKVRG